MSAGPIKDPPKRSMFTRVDHLRCRCDFCKKTVRNSDQGRADHLRVERCQIKAEEKKKALAATKDKEEAA